MKLHKKKNSTPGAKKTQKTYSHDFEVGRAAKKTSIVKVPTPSKKVPKKKTVEKDINTSKTTYAYVSTYPPLHSGCACIWHYCVTLLRLVTCCIEVNVQYNIMELCAYLHTNSVYSCSHAVILSYFMKEFMQK